MESFLALFVLTASTVLQLCSGSGSITLKMTALTPLVDPPPALNSARCDPSGTCEPFLKVCFTPTNFESCVESEFFTEIYEPFPVDLVAEFTPGFRIDVNMFTVASVGVFAYDHDDPANPLRLNSNTPLANLSHMIPVTRGVQVLQFTSSNYRLDYEICAECDPDFFGPDCGTMCIPQDDVVNGHYTCSNSADIFDCLPGFENPTGTPPCLDVIQLCTPNPCMNGGSCMMQGPGEFTCACATGFTGETCAADIDECAVISPCVNGGVCSQTQTPGGFSCSCPVPFTGPRCETLVNPCDSSPCFNGGTCLRTSLDGFLCRCTRGVAGTNCETAVNPCRPNPCQNGGSCTQSGPGEFSCACAPGYTGQTCIAMVDICASNPCKNGATCTQTGLLTFSCACPVGFEGTTCDADINECASSPSPCQNGGRCTNSVGSFVCCCAPNFEGRTCGTTRVRYNLLNFLNNYYYAPYLAQAINAACPDVAFISAYVVEVVGQAQESCFLGVTSYFRAFGFAKARPTNQGSPSSQGEVSSNSGQGANTDATTNPTTNPSGPNSPAPQPNRPNNATPKQSGPMVPVRQPARPNNPVHQLNIPEKAAYQPGRTNNAGSTSGGNKPSAQNSRYG